MTKILFITSTRIGDAVLSTGLLDHILKTYDDPQVTIVCGPLAASLFEGYPALHELIALKKEKRNGHWVKLWKRAFPTKWDVVIDLRNSVVSRLLRAKERYIYGPHIDGEAHKVVQNAMTMRLSSAPAPKLWFTDAQLAKAAELIPDGETPVIGVGPTANWIGKTWPTDRFIEIVSFLRSAGSPYEGARVAVFAAPGEEPAAREVLASVPEGMGLDIIAKASPAEAAAALSRCDFYIGNDSGLMHCAAASGVPTFGVFGASWPHLYGPWGVHTAYARTPETFAELTDYEGYHPSQLTETLMGSLTTEMVKDELSHFFEKLKKPA
ncbi:MAG: glycosyltransferase family 9 protein [Pseudobdellovibrionaceae bacterium]